MIFMVWTRITFPKSNDEFIYLSFLTRLKEAIPLSKLRGESGGVLSPHGRPGRVLRRYSFIPSLNTRNITLSTEKNHV